MASLSGVSSLDDLVAQYRASLNKPVDDLQTQQDNLNARLTALNSLKAKLSTLQSSVNNFALSGTSSPFLKYSVDSSDTTVAAATATSLAVAGTHALKVSQLASNDTLLSARLTAAADSGLAANSAFSFSLAVGGGAARTVTVQLGGATTNGDVMSAVASAVNADTTLNTQVTASVVKVSETESRLVFTAKDSGASHAITSVGGDFGSLLGFGGVDFTGRTASTSTGAGFVNSGVATDSLNAKFTFDGIEVSRESNAVNDVIPGVTLTLKSVQAGSAAPITLQVAIDKDSVVKAVQQFITDYNTAISYMQTNTATDAASKTRGVLGSDATTLMVRSSIRGIIGGAVAGVAPGNPQDLADIGIKINRDGTLILSDQSTLTAAITADIHKVSDLFTNSSGNGIATLMKASIDSVLGSGGSLASTTSSLNNQITAISDRMKSLNDQFDKKADAFRTQFAQVQVLIAQAQQQQQMMASFYA